MITRNTPAGQAHHIDTHRVCPMREAEDLHSFGVRGWVVAVAFAVFCAVVPAFFQ